MVVFNYFNFADYRKRTGELNVTVMEEDLRLCTVKPVLDGERRFCFEVLSPSKYVTTIFVLLSLNARWQKMGTKVGT